MCEPKADAMLGQVLESPTLIEPAASDGAHLVVQVRPSHAPAPIAEANEIGCLRGQLDLSCSAGIHRWRALLPSVELITAGPGAGPGAQPTPGLARPPDQRRGVCDRGADPGLPILELFVPVLRAGADDRQGSRSPRARTRDL